MWICCYLLVGCLAVLVILYALVELHYFLRMCLCVVLARFIKRKCSILDTTVVQGICLTTDIDTLLYHMNNARYLRELDFARVDFYERTHLYRTIVAKGGSVFQGAATIRYRRFIRPFHRFSIISRIIYWDEQSIFMEHRFVRPADKFIHAIAICRQRLVDCSAEEVMNDLLVVGDTTLLQTSSTNIASSSFSLEDTTAQSGAGSYLDQVENGCVRVKLKPEIPVEIAKWIEYNDISSKNLRKGC